MLSQKSSNRKNKMNYNKSLKLEITTRSAKNDFRSATFLGNRETTASLTEKRAEKRLTENSTQREADKKKKNKRHEQAQATKEAAEQGASNISSTMRRISPLKKSEHHSRINQPTN